MKMKMEKTINSTRDNGKLTRHAVPDLPPPTTGYSLRHVAVGRGTQNYTCDAGNASVAPLANGAVATLFNASCVAALYPELLNTIPGMAVHFNLSEDVQLGPSSLSVSGHHYFQNATTPFFNLDTPTLDIGEAPCAKNNSVAAPSTAATGQQGEAAVAWLKLTARDGSTNNIKEVFRVTTAGGSPPKTCESQAATFEVQYSAV